MKNKMKKIAKMYNLKLGQEFILSGTMSNPYKITERGLADRDNSINNFMLLKLLIGESEIISPLLTDEEKVYLENVLRPYKEDVLYIRLRAGTNGNFLGITINYEENTEDVDWFNFPYIKKYHFQYKGLEKNKDYTLEELGLFEGE